jgi:hypothetical protein
MQDFYADLAAASLEDPKDFAESVLLLAKQNLGLVAGSFYLYTPETQTLRLKAQIGFSSVDYGDFHLSLASFAGESIRTGKTVVDSAPMHSDLFRDKKLLEHIQVGGIVAAPLPLSDLISGSHRRYLPLSTRVCSAPFPIRLGHNLRTLPSPPVPCNA